MYQARNLTGPILGLVRRFTRDSDRENALVREEAAIHQTAREAERPLSDDETERLWQIHAELQGTRSRLAWNDAQAPGVLGVPPAPVRPPQVAQQMRQPSPPPPPPPQPTPESHSPSVWSKLKSLAWRILKLLLLVIFIGAILFWARHNIAFYGSAVSDGIRDGADVITPENISDAWDDLITDDSDPVMELTVELKEKARNASADPELITEINSIQVEQSTADKEHVLMYLERMDKKLDAWIENHEHPAPVATTMPVVTPAPVEIPVQIPTNCSAIVNPGESQSGYQPPADLWKYLDAQCPFD